jgi:two-component system NtrC family sensor kinase
VIEAAHAACRPALEERRIHARLDLAPDLPDVLGDAEQLRHVFINLLQNAQDAIVTKGGPGEVRITATRSASPERLRMTVEDNGPGIAEGILEKVFDPFFTTHGTGEGAGLGLTLCCLIVKQHGGSIQAGNRPEGGARIEVELPVAAGWQDEAHPAAPGAARVRRILVVDDQEAVARFAADALQLDGHQVEVALGGAAAAARLGERDYDLVLMDFSMPGMRGDELYRRAAARKRPAPRVAVMTADKADSDAAAFLAATHLPVLQKPFSIEAIRSFVRGVLAAPAPDDGHADPHLASD